MLKKKLQETFWKAVVFSAIAVGKAQEALEEANKKRELKKKEDKLRRGIPSVWDAMG